MEVRFEGGRLESLWLHQLERVEEPRHRRSWRGFLSGSSKEAPRLCAPASRRALPLLRSTNQPGAYIEGVESSLQALGGG